MARSSAAASKPAKLTHAGQSDDLSLEQKLEDYVLPQTSAIVMALRKLAAY